jgi:cold-inducible RNA-binding protein
MKLYVGNLSYDLTEDDLKQKFLEYGEVTSVSILMDRETGRPKGFGFVEMASKPQAEAAIAGLNGKMINERTIVVNEARPRTENRTSGGGRSGGYGGGSGGYGGGSGGGRGGENRRRY